MLASPRKNGPDSLFKEVRVLKVSLLHENHSRHLAAVCNVKHGDSTPESMWALRATPQRGARPQK